MIRIEHVALWVSELERAREFYETYFGLKAGEKYYNPKKGFRSYFLSGSDGGPRLELMHRQDLVFGPEPRDRTAGWAHIAFSLGSKEAVDELTAALTSNGHTIVDGPRTTGDGYYESVVLDPEGNRVELTV